MSNRNINILYYNTDIQSKDTVLNACIPIDINVSFTDSFQNLYEMIVSLDEIDLVFIDYNGEEEVLKIISSIHKYDEDLVIYVLSHITDDEEQIKIYSSGATEYLLLPVNSQVLQARLKNMAGLRDSRRKLNEEVESAVSVIKERELESLLLLGRTSEYKDRDTGSHILRVGRYSELIMEKLGGSKEDQELMLYAAPLHDVGKIAIPDQILNKPGRLTAEEFELMKTHTVKGCQLLEQIPQYRTNPLYLYAHDICRHHHERWDGRGYPDKLAGDEIPLWAHVVALADVYDALTNERCYKPPFSHQEAMEMILGGQCGVFNPALLSAFCRLFDPSAPDVSC